MLYPLNHGSKQLEQVAGSPDVLADRCIIGVTSQTWSVLLLLLLLLTGTTTGTGSRIATAYWQRMTYHTRIIRNTRPKTTYWYSLL
jgi:hypothetical protein